MTFEYALASKANARTLVSLYVMENGAQARGLMAEACKLSERAVHKAISELKALGLWENLVNTRSVSSHEIMDHQSEGTANNRAAAKPKRVNEYSDPLYAKLVSKTWRVLGGALCKAIKRWGRAAVEAAVKAVEAAQASGIKVRSPWGLALHELNAPGSVGPHDSYYRKQEHARSNHTPEQPKERLVPVQAPEREVTHAERVMNVVKVWVNTSEKIARSTATRQGIAWADVVAAKAAVV